VHQDAIAPEREAGASWLMLVVLMDGQFMGSSRM